MGRRTPQLLSEPSRSKVALQNLRITGVGRSTRAAMTPEQAQEPGLGPQQLSHRLAISRPQRRIDGAVTGVLEHAITTAGAQPCDHQSLWIEQIRLQPAQLPQLFTMQTPRLSQGFSAEIQAHHREPHGGQQSRLMAAATTRHEHTAWWPRSQRVLTKKLL